MTTDLGLLFNKYGSDKESYHHYSEIYTQLIGEHASDVDRVLEIGVFEGASLRAWRDYFPNAFIVGMDKDYSQCNVFDLDGGDWTKSRIQLIEGDQSSPFDLDRAFRHGPFDLIVDDGSHLIGDQLTSLLYLWGAVRQGGWYVIEDITNTADLYTLQFLPNSRVEILSASNHSILVAIQKPVH